MKFRALDLGFGDVKEALVGYWYLNPELRMVIRTVAEKVHSSWQGSQHCT